MNRTIHHARPQEPARSRALAARPGRLTAAGLVLLTLSAVLLLFWAVAAQASVWVIPAMSRAYPETKAGSRQSIAIDAAGNEYQGVQVCLRGGGDRAVTLSWASGSDPLIVDNAKLHRVYYVNVTTPTTALGSRRGMYPDPLVPRDFGAKQQLPGNTTPMYILVHVPYGTPRGTYTATLHVENGDETVDVPFSLRVWGFGWTEISTHSAFSVSEAHLKRSLAGRLDMSGEAKQRVLTAFYTMMREHGVSPTVVHYLPKVSASGHAAVSDWASKVAPFLDADALGLPDNQLPWLRWFPWSRSKSPSAATIETYLTEMTRAYKERGWHSKAYVYIVDETNSTSEERLAEKYARLAHKASAKSGYRIRFLLTDDPRPHALGGGMKNANTFLYDDVDIWTLRYYYFFGRIPAVRERQRAGKEIWWYSYTNGAVRKTPSFVIDKPHIDSRAWGWLMERWNVDGLLNWGFNRWGKPTSSSGWRDPYRNPLSLVKDSVRSNGDTCLVYPGYYPRYGLNDPYAAPVSSLRLEALRDGLEEREYLRLAKASGRDGQALATRVLKSITSFPYKIQQKNVFNFPKYTSSNAVFDAARKQLAVFIEAHTTQ
jgi:Domain of unknown function (DUF4091)